MPRKIAWYDEAVGLPHGVVLLPCEGEMRVPDSGLRSVVYLGIGNSPENFQVAGTGFLVDLRRKGRPRAYYLVTADHVARELGQNQFAIRFNDHKGNARIEQSQPYFKWWRHPTKSKSVDAAVFPWGFQGDYTTFPIDRFYTGAKNDPDIGIGDEIFIIGLFRQWAGRRGISPIVRQGHVAMMTPEPVDLTNYPNASVYFIEALSLGGLSGSPVFVRESVKLPMLLNPQDKETTPVLAPGRIYLLGLMHGYWKTQEAEQEQEWHSGISIVVPSTEIVDILDQPELIAYEARLDTLAKNLPIAATSAVEPRSQSTTPRQGKGVQIPIPKKTYFLGDLGRATRRKKPSE